jgi:hypothetical protein
MNFHALLTRGFEQRYRKPDVSEDIEHVHLVDWHNVANNDLCVVNQFSIRGQNDRRPDVLIYLNGFPVVLFELKNPYEEEPNTLGAFNQVQHYKAGISQLFDFNALVIVSDGGMIVPVSDDAPKEAGSTLHGPWRPRGSGSRRREHQWPRCGGERHGGDEDSDRGLVSEGSVARLHPAFHRLRGGERQDREEGREVSPVLRHPFRGG